MSRCPITGANPCIDRHCELHYMQAPLRLAVSGYADQIMAAIAHDERFGPLTNQTINTYADVCKHADVTEYTERFGLNLHGDDVNDVLHADFVEAVQTLVDRQLNARATAREHLHTIMLAMHAVAAIDVPGTLGMIADTRSTFHCSLWTAAYELTLALVRLAAPTHDLQLIPGITANVLATYLIDPNNPAPIADRIHEALDVDTPF